MATECSAEQFEFGVVESRAVVAAFDGGLVARFNQLERLW